MKIDKFGRVSITEQEAFESIYEGKLTLHDKIYIDNGISQYNSAVIENADNFSLLLEKKDLSDIDIKFFDKSNQGNWFMPDEYKTFPIHQWLLDQCNTPQEKERIELELKLFIQHNIFDLLFYLKYLVDTMRSNNIVWGVGRGSCVASYVLFLIGVHKVNSLKYDLDIREFLREN